jgi:hypothetical protein
MRKAAKRIPAKNERPATASGEPLTNLVNLTVLRRVMLPGDGYNGDKVLEAGMIFPASLLPADAIKRLLDNGAVKRTWLKPSDPEDMAAIQRAEAVRLKKERNSK